MYLRALGVFTCLPFCLHFKHGRSSWPISPPGALAKRMQMSISTMALTAACSQPKTEDKAASPFIRNLWSPCSDTSRSPQHCSSPKSHVTTLPRYPLPKAFPWTHRWAFGLVPTRNGHSVQNLVKPPASWCPCLHPFNVSSQSERDLVKDKQLVSFCFYSLALDQAFICSHCTGQNYCAEWTKAEEKRREGGLSKKRVGVKSLIALISVLAAHPFSWSSLAVWFRPRPHCSAPHYCSHMKINSLEDPP